MTSNKSTSNQPARGKKPAGYMKSLLFDTICPILFVVCAICCSALVSPASRVEADSTTEYTIKGVLMTIFVLGLLSSVYLVSYRFQHLTKSNLEFVMAGYAILDVVTILFGLNSLKEFLSLNTVANLLIVIAVNSWASALLTCVPCPEPCFTDALGLDEKAELGRGFHGEKTDLRLV